MTQDENLFTRQQVYAACLLAEAEGVDCGAFRNPCDRIDRGQYRLDFYQEIARKYFRAIPQASVWEIYTASPRYKAKMAAFSTYP
jgi:hypothetical protein